jgi:hypothetical protein
MMQAPGQPLGFIDAFILESLGSGVRAAAFLVPWALGALEGSFVLFGSLFGLPAEAALAISLSKRVRDLALGLPGLVVWQWDRGALSPAPGRANTCHGCLLQCGQSGFTPVRPSLTDQRAFASLHERGSLQLHACQFAVL